MQRLEPAQSVSAKEAGHDSREDVDRTLQEASTTRATPPVREMTGEAALQRRARKLGLLLMAASALFVVTLLAAAWVLLRY